MSNDESQLYNIRIIRTYVEYLEKYHPEIDLDEILNYAGLIRSRLDDDGYWYTQAQADRFHEITNSKIKNRPFAREAGRYVVYSKAYKIIRQYLFGFIMPATAYELIAKVTSKVTRGSILSVKVINPHQVQVISTPSPGVNEKSYQCENRFGQFEAMAAIMTGKYATIEHPQCYHRGDDFCRYLISWEETSSLVLRRYRNIFLLVSLLAIGVGLILFPTLINLMLFFTCFVLLSGMTFLSWYLEKEDFKKQVSEQSHTAEQLMEETKIRVNETKLIKEIGQAISRILDIDVLLNVIINTLVTRLDFDRGMILLGNKDKTRLVYKTGYGFNDKQEEYFRRNDFNLDNPNSKGPFVVAFKEKTPYLVSDISSINEDLSERSKEYMGLADSGSFICVPIAYEDEPLGVLAVDRGNSKNNLKESDLELLMGIAPQIAISITNARFFEKMQSSEEKYRVLVESANSIIMRLDTQGRITFLNKYGQEFYGYSEKEILGKNALGLILPNIDSSGKDFSAIFSDFLAHPERHENFENENIRRNREKVWVSWSNKAICDRDGSLAEILCVGNDITERKKAEQEKKSLELQLVRSQKMEAIGTLAGGVAHDLNNILSGIVSYPEILLMEVQDDSPMRKSLEVIKRSGEKAAAIVQDLLTLARRGVSVSNVVNLNSIIEEYFKSPEYSKLVQYHPLVTFDFHLEDELSNVLGSSVHLSKTLMNLVSNAAEAMPKGGTITVSTKNKSVEQAINGYDVIGKGEYVVMSVADSGIGISPEDVKRIFEPFYSKKEMGRSGTGLGMAVIWSTVKDHQGYIDVKTEVGSGTQFDLYFPVTGMEMKAQDLKQPIQAYKGTEKILVVDDVAEQREIAKEFLGKLGYQVDVACSGEEALAYLKDRKADLVLLDMIMDPGMDGLATYEKILEMNERQKAIIVSGFSESDRVKQALSLGAGAYVKKPYVLHDIARSVREELDKGLR